MIGDEIRKWWLCSHYGITVVAWNSSLDSRFCSRPLYIATLDTQTAFDVLSHPVLMVKLDEQSINSHQWQLIRSMHRDLITKVKLDGEVSSSINIRQGLRQCGILSTQFYNTYNNDLLTVLESRCLGKFIGPIYLGCPTVAADVLFLSDDMLSCSLCSICRILNLKRSVTIYIHERLL